MNKYVVGFYAAGMAATLLSVLWIAACAAFDIRGGLLGKGAFAGFAVAVLCGLGMLLSFVLSRED